MHLPKLGTGQGPNSLIDHQSLHKTVSEVFGHYTSMNYKGGPGEGGNLLEETFYHE